MQLCMCALLHLCFKCAGVHAHVYAQNFESTNYSGRSSGTPYQVKAFEPPGPNFCIGCERKERMHIESSMAPRGIFSIGFVGFILPVLFRPLFEAVLGIQVWLKQYCCGFITLPLNKLEPFRQPSVCLYLLFALIVNAPSEDSMSSNPNIVTLLILLASPYIEGKGFCFFCIYLLTYLSTCRLIYLSITLSYYPFTHSLNHWFVPSCFRLFVRSFIFLLFLDSSAHSTTNTHVFACQSLSKTGRSVCAMNLHFALIFQERPKDFCSEFFRYSGKLLGDNSVQKMHHNYFIAKCTDCIAPCQFHPISVVNVPQVGTLPSGMLPTM